MERSAMIGGNNLRDDPMQVDGRTTSYLIGGGIGLGGFAAGMLLAWAAVPLAAQAEPADPSAPPQRTISATVYGNDPCPTGSGGEIIVCARRPESERYRLPKRFRGQKASESPASDAWANKVQATDAASRMAAGLPDTCSAVGSGGQSGCQHQFLSQARAERKADQADVAGTP
jgi:hypothetical protein